MQCAALGRDRSKSLRQTGHRCARALPSSGSEQRHESLVTARRLRSEALDQRERPDRGIIQRRAVRFPGIPVENGKLTDMNS